MKLARVVGNVVSTVKDACYTGQKLMIIDYIDENGSLTGNQAIAFDVADAGIGDTVLVNVEGGSANMFLGRSVIADLTICGVIDAFPHSTKQVRWIWISKRSGNRWSSRSCSTSIWNRR